MNRFYLTIVCFAFALSSVGCVGPMGVGPGCGVSNCYDCDGVGYGDRVIPMRPLDGLRQMRKNLVCGSGCGEVYYGEWISTPPDCADPCCGEQFVGGATPCRPGCWQPGILLRSLYGGRNCTGEQSSTPCGCGDHACDGGCSFVSSVTSGGYVSSPSPMVAAPASSCGCASASPVGIRTQVVRRSVPPTDMLTR